LEGSGEVKTYVGDGDRLLGFTTEILEQVLDEDGALISTPSEVVMLMSLTPSAVVEAIAVASLCGVKVVIEVG
jgi:hypothetical protein